MPKRNRDTLKSRFCDGAMPGTREFSDLIESMLNIQDDGIAHNPDDGLRLTQVAGSRRVLSFYGAVEERSPVWALGLDPHASSLLLEVSNHVSEGEQGRRQPERDGDGGGVAVLTLVADEAQQGARIGINRSAPRFAVDVDGTVASSGRSGAPGTRAAPADGQWHTISEALDGCNALEIVAGAGKRGSGKYAIMHAFALRTFGAKGDITYHQAHFASRRHRMELRWVAADTAPDGPYQLQIRVNCTYGEGVWIRYSLSRLWFDPFMDDCLADPAGEERS